MLLDLGGGACESAVLLSADLLPPGAARASVVRHRATRSAQPSARSAPIADAERENESRVAEFYTRDELLAGECVARPPPHGLLCLRVEALPPPTGDAAEGARAAPPSSPRCAGCAARRPSACAATRRRRRCARASMR